MSNEREVFGLKVIGEIRPGQRFIAQKPPVLLVDALNALLDINGVDHVVWQQYTPYFNDGDPCYFRAGCLQIYGQSEYQQDMLVIMKDLPARREYDYQLGEYIQYAAGPREQAYSVGYEFEVTKSEEYPHPEFEPDHPAMDLALKVNNMLESGAFDLFLSQTFGDHTEVRFDGLTFTHEEYDHD